MNILSGFILIKGIPFLMFSTFVCIFLGLLLGRINIKGVSLGSSGVFIIALLYGSLFSSHIKSTISQATKDGKNIDISSNGLKILENIGLVLFIGSVGFISGPNFFTNLKKNFKSYLIVGLLVILTATLTSVIIFYIGKKSEENTEEFTAMIAGIFAGSLTSTPAFSAAKASAEGEYESAVTVGYGLAYIFGVIGVVLFVQIVPKISNVDMDIERDLIIDKEYKITKRVGTDRTEQSDGTKIGRSLSGEIQNIDKISVMKAKKGNISDKNEKVRKKDKKSKFYLEVSVKNEKKDKEKNKHHKIEKTENGDLDTKNNAITSERKIKFSQNFETEQEKEIEIEKYVIEEEKENEDNSPEERENEDNNEEKENEDKNAEERENEDNNEEKENEDKNAEDKENEDNNKVEKEKERKINKTEKLIVLDKYGFCVFGFGALVGIFIGAIRIPLSKEGFNGSAFSLTTTGGVLLTCLILGHLGKIKKLSLKVDKKILENLRELGLILFLLGSGIAGGTKFIEYFKVIYFLYGIFITIIPLIVGFFFNKYILKLCLLNNLGSLTGAMTSTPALGTLINVAKTDSIGNSYAATYPISLITVVLSAQFMILLLK